MQQNHKTFGNPPAELVKDLQDRIDTSDQDEDASYEELNEEDLKTHSSKKDDDEDYSEPEDQSLRPESNLKMEDIQRMQKSLKQQSPDMDDSYSDQTEQEK